VTFRAWSHPLCCMAKSAPVRRLRGVVTRNLPEPGRSSPLKAEWDGRSATVPFPFPEPADRPAPIRCTHPRPAATRNPSSQPPECRNPISRPSTLNSGG
jgi:hypothetical protein